MYRLVCFCDHAPPPATGFHIIVADFDFLNWSWARWASQDRSSSDLQETWASHNWSSNLFSSSQATDSGHHWLSSPVNELIMSLKCQWLSCLLRMSFLAMIWQVHEWVRITNPQSWNICEWMKSHSGNMEVIRVFTGFLALIWAHLPYF